MSYLAMVLCCGGYGLVAHGMHIQSPAINSVGFLASLVGSLIWFALSARRRQWAMAAQSIFFAGFSFWGLT